MQRYNSASPFLCMDLAYITALLKEGFGFRDNTLLQVRKTVKSQSQLPNLPYQSMCIISFFWLIINWDFPESLHVVAVICATLENCQEQLLSLSL